MIDMNSILQSMELHRAALVEAGKINKETVFNTLSAAGIERVSVTFDGEGDSGQIEEVTAYKAKMPVALPDVQVMMQCADGHSETVRRQNLPLSQALEHLFYDFLGQDHGGWENNDGAYGEFMLTVATRTVELEFSGRYSDVHISHYTF